MDGKRARTDFIAAKATACIFGILSGLGGLVHGIGEVLQGNVATTGIWINSWTQGPIATNMGGEPGITIIPNILVAGILTIIASLAVILWSTAFVQKKAGGLILILLSIFMLLMGGGIGPPVFGILAGVAGLGIHAALRGWSKPASAGARRFFSALWPWFFAAAILVGVFVVIGSFVLVYLIDFNHPDLFTNGFYASVILLILINIMGRAFDAHRKQDD